MNALKTAINRLLRGPAASRLLARMGIHARRFWLLTDVLGELSERGEVTDQLGSNTIALRTIAWMYFAMSGFLSLVFLLGRPGPLTFSLLSMTINTFLLLTILLSEAANSLVNPTEALAVAHQPINGATYTAAKIAHLVRIVAYLVPGMNLIPALALLLLKGARWYFPALHLLAAFGVGLFMALLCCAAFGWLIRYVPPRRLKAAALLFTVLPFTAMFWMSAARRLASRIEFPVWLPPGSAARWTAIAVVAAAAAAVIAFGIRSLSVDYLIRVSGMMRGGSAAAAATGRRSRIGDLVARTSGGQAGRAGFAYVSRMMLRDFQFRRQVLPMLPALLIPILPLVRNLKLDPFGGKFTAVHLAPHMFGTLMYFICAVITYGADYKGTWIFLLAPSGAFGRFARGTHAFLLTAVILIPNAVLLLPLAWFWGLWHAALFTLYSMAAGALYLAIELRLIEGVPFGKQAEPTRAPASMLLVIVGGGAIALAVGIQHFVLFRSPALVALATAVVSVAAYYLTRSSLRAFEASIRYNLSLLSVESGTLYKEIAT